MKSSNRPSRKIGPGHEKGGLFSNPLRSLFLAALIVLPLFAFTFQHPLRGEEKKALALVVRAVGKSEVTRQEKSGPILTNMLLYEGDLLHVPPKSRVVIQFSTGIICQLGSDQRETGARIDDLRDELGERKVKVTMLSGELLSSTQKLSRGERFSVATPTAVAGVRGTQFLVESDEASTTLMVKEGKVLIQDLKSQKEVMVEALEKATVDATGLKKEVMKKFEEDRFRVIQQLEGIRKRNFEELIRQKEKNQELLQKNKWSIRNLFP